ncbi:hypothetical protein AVEN_275745-1 [Araneus ventricosus]|uniref:Uncharacterized protein n=1 Tax=Araneus ventricosus TaxID=182803 RepID=A0A4Y2HN88_ARAVE|nr:hypothetical protein AVEN_275745-1 [Araneus ventricosus]
MTVSLKSIHYQSLRSPTAPIPSLAFKERIPAWSDFLKRDIHLKSKMEILEHGKENNNRQGRKLMKIRIAASRSRICKQTKIQQFVSQFFERPFARVVGTSKA